MPFVHGQTSMLFIDTENRVSRICFHPPQVPLTHPPPPPWCKVTKDTFKRLIYPRMFGLLSTKFYISCVIIVSRGCSSMLCTLLSLRRSKDQWDGSPGKAPATKPIDLSSMPGTHVVEGENWFQILWPLHECFGMCIHAHSHTYTHVHMLHTHIHAHVYTCTHAYACSCK